MNDTVLDNEIKVGTVENAEEFDKAEKPEMIKLWIDLGEETVQSAAQLGYNHDADELEGEQVLTVTDLGSMRIAGFKSQVLTLGVPDEDGNPVLVTPDQDVPKGGRLF